LGWEIPNAIGEIASPKCRHTLLTIHTTEAIADASVSGNFSASDSWVGILGLDQQLHSLNWSRQSFGHSSGHTSKAKIHGPCLERHFSFLFGHGWSLYGLNPDAEETKES